MSADLTDGIAVSRIVVVDYRKNAQKRGRAYDSHYPCDIDVVLQDDGKTLKAFVYDPEERRG